MFTGIGSITKLSDAQSRSITAENVYGEKGRGGMADLTEKAQPEVAKIGQKWDGDREFPTICGTGTEDYFGVSTHRFFDFGWVLMNKEPPP